MELGVRGIIFAGLGLLLVALTLLGLGSYLGITWSTVATEYMGVAIFLVLSLVGIFTLFRLARH